MKPALAYATCAFCKLVGHELEERELEPVEVLMYRAHLQGYHGMTCWASSGLPADKIHGGLSQRGTTLTEVFGTIPPKCIESWGRDSAYGILIAAWSLRSNFGMAIEGSSNFRMPPTLIDPSCAKPWPKLTLEESAPAEFRSDETKSPSQSKSRFKNRSRLEIASTILTRAKSGSLKTHLMYGANLSFPLIEEYLGILTKAGLILQDPEVDGAPILYRTTGKGLDFLTHYEMITSLMGDQSFLMAGRNPISDDQKKFLCNRGMNSPKITIATRMDGKSYEQ